MKKEGQFAGLMRNQLEEAAQYITMNLQETEEQDAYICPAHRAGSFKRYSRRKEHSRFVRDFNVYECEDCRNCHVRNQCSKAKSSRKRQIQVNNNWRYFKVGCKKKLL